MSRRAIDSGEACVVLVDDQVEIGAGEHDRFHVIASTQRVRELTQSIDFRRRGATLLRQLQIDAVNLVDFLRLRRHDVESIKRAEKLCVDREPGAKQRDARQSLSAGSWP